jgi:hypothetical protein
MPYTINFESPEIVQASVPTHLPEFNEDALFAPTVCSELTNGFRYSDLTEVAPHD